MTDNELELLKLASKAAGLDFTSWTSEIRDHDSPHYGSPALYKNYECYSWNPLTDDGDALRLAVKLGMHVNVSDDETFIILPDAPLSDDAIAEPFRNDPQAATRRAIVRAAAEIGKTL